MELEAARKAPASWTRLPISNVCEKFTSGGTPSRKRPEYYEGGTIPWVKTKELHDRPILDTEEHITAEALASSSAKLLPTQTILMAMYGATVGQLGRLGVPMACNQACAAIIIDPVKASADYLYYQLLAHREQIVSFATGAAQQNLSGAQIKQFILPFPSLAEQNAIGGLLRALDDKIELNRRMNETLEAMARAIFKDWFVDFGPTRAKAARRGHPTQPKYDRPPYLAPDLWDLFPDALDDDGKPVGWTQGNLADVADSPRRSIAPADVSEDTPYIGLEHMPRRSIALTEWEGAGKVTSNKSEFKRGEFLFGKLRPYFHKVGFAPLDGICSTDIVVVTPRAPHWAAFTLACLSSDEFVDYTDQTSTGTKMPRTSWKIMGQYKLYLPPEPAAQAFENTVRPLIDRIVANIHESRTLAQIRDLLLPKLMSGEIRLREAEKAVEAVA